MVFLLRGQRGLIGQLFPYRTSTLGEFIPRREANTLALGHDPAGSERDTEGQSFSQLPTYPKAWKLACPDIDGTNGLESKGEDQV